MAKVEKTEQEWREVLSENEFYVCRHKGTERAFTGEYWDCKKNVIYHCRACGQALFSSATNYDSGSGWPSYYEPIVPGAVSELVDTSHGMRRIEVLCSACESHLGHVFPDGPKPTGLRYCINSASIKLEEK